MDPISELENALGAELLRAGLLGAARPKIAGRYLIEKFLGRGATGLVVAALDDRLGRPVALKLGIATADTTMLAEARALALLDHPNVVRVHDVDLGNAVFDGTPFRLWLVSMQRVEGRNLRVWLQERRRTPPEIVRVFVDAGRGLAAAHAAKIVHRDVKPDNIFVREDGVAQVLDFGFAVPAASEGQQARRESAGTEGYMAPEARDGRATRSSDQFAFGVSLVEAFTGEAQPAGRRAPEGVPAGVWRSLRRMTAHDPSRRFGDMNTAVEALAREPRGGLWKALLLGVTVLAAVAGVVLVGARGPRSPVSAQRVDGVEAAADQVSCARLPQVLCFRSTVASDAPPQYLGDWGDYQVRRSGGTACAPRVEVERLRDNVQFRGYRSPGYFLGETVAHVAPSGSRELTLDVVTVFIRNGGKGGGRDYGFHLTISLDGAVRGTAWKPHGSRGLRDWNEIVTPVSRSACVAGHDARSTE